MQTGALASEVLVSGTRVISELIVREIECRQRPAGTLHDDRTPVTNQTQNDAQMQITCSVCFVP